MLKLKNHMGPTEQSMILFFAIYVLISLPVILITRRFIHIMMIWNVFLALLPLFFSLQFPSGWINRDKKRVWLFGVLWLLFFPNAPYMITDFIHLQGFSFYTFNTQDSQTVYSTHLSTWISLIHIGIGVLMGTYSGMLSFHIVRSVLTRNIGSAATHVVVILISLISGYAVYIGRFLRFNSWDIFRPTAFLSELFSHFNLFSASISLLFSLYILLVFWLFEIVFSFQHR